MRELWRWTIGLIVPVMLVASAQVATVQAAEGPVPEAETVELLLLRQEAVQHELKLDKKEIAAIKKFTHEQHHKAMKAEKLSKSESEQKYADMAKENEDFLKDHLNAQQRQRLMEIAMQRASLLWVTKPSIEKKLNLTDKQKQTVEAEQRKARLATDDALAAKGAEERNRKLKKVTDDSRQSLANLLTKEQKSKWDEMVGAPFDKEFVIEVFEVETVEPK